MKKQAKFLALLVLAGMAAGGGTSQPSAPPSSAQLAVARVQLECLLQRRLRERDALLGARRRLEEHLRRTEAFRAGLDPARNADSISLAEQALDRDREGLAANTGQLREAERRLAEVRRAIANLVPPPRPPPLAEQARAAGYVGLANALHCGGREEDSPVRGAPLLVRLVADDACGGQTDADVESRHGLSANVAARDRLNTLLARLDRVAPGARVQIVRDCLPDIAVASSRTVYIGECMLGPAQTDDEIAFILAHERAHVALQHVTLTLLQQAWNQRQHGEVPEGVDPSRHPQALAVAIAATMGDFSQDQEREADLQGAAIALAAGFSPTGIDQFFDRVQRIVDRNERARLARLSPEARLRHRNDIAARAARRSVDAHPLPAERRAALEEVLGRSTLGTDPLLGRCRPWPRVPR